MTSPRDLCRLLATCVGAITLTSSGAFLVACRKDAPKTTDGSEPPAQEAAAVDREAGALASDVPGDAGLSGHDPSERADRSAHEAGAVGPKCEGAALSLLAAAVNPQCEIGEREWSDLVHAAGAGGAGGASSNGVLRQEARREGDHVVISIVNRGARSLVVPLRYHPGHPELAFSVLAESEGRGVFELATPSNDAPSEAEAGKPKATTARGLGPERPNVLALLDAGSWFQRVHNARITLPPGGSARARLAIDPRIVKRLDRSCTDGGGAARTGSTDGGGAARTGGADGGDAAGACLPARLPKGRTVLYVGQLVTAIDSGEPARVEWDAP